MQFSFVHAADIHLDSPLGGLEKYEGAPVNYVRGATRKAFENLIDFCLAEQVRFLLLAGDLYDGDWRDYNAGLFFTAQMNRLKEAGIQVFVVKGNHDAASQISRQLRLPENVSVFASGDPSSHTMEELGVIIHGCSFETAAETEDLSLRYPANVPGYLNIGLLHTSAGGRDGHENYAPCKVSYLENKGYDYWALGHVHQREVLRDGNPWILFPGNLQGRHVRETGAKGCTLVRVSDGVIDRVKAVSLDVLRWHVGRVNLQGAISLEECYQRAEVEMVNAIRLAEGRMLGLRLVLEGRTSIHGDLLNHRQEVVNNLRALAGEVGRNELWLEKVKIESSSEIDSRQLAAEHSAFAFLFEYIEALKGDADICQEIQRELSDLKNYLPVALSTGDGDVNLNESQEILALLDEVEELLLDRMSGKGERK